MAIMRLIPGAGYVYDPESSTNIRLIPGAGYVTGVNTAGVTGTIAVTNANDTGSFTGTTTVVGTVNYTNNNDTGNFSGTVGSGGSTGTIAVTNNNDSGSFTGTTTIVGTIAYTNNNDIGVFSGFAGSVTGTIDVTNNNDIGNFVGETTVSQEATRGTLLGNGRSSSKKKLAYSSWNLYYENKLLAKELKEEKVKKKEISSLEKKAEKIKEKLIKLEDPVKPVKKIEEKKSSLNIELLSVLDRIDQEIKSLEEINRKKSLYRKNVLLLVLIMASPYKNVRIA